LHQLKQQVRSSGDGQPTNGTPGKGIYPVDELTEEALAQHDYWLE
jgi:hypothetical protein